MVKLKLIWFFCLTLFRKTPRIPKAAKEFFLDVAWQFVKILSLKLSVWLWDIYGVNHNLKQAPALIRFQSNRTSTTGVSASEAWRIVKKAETV